MRNPLDLIQRADYCGLPGSPQSQIVRFGDVRARGITLVLGTQRRTTLPPPVGTYCSRKLRIAKFTSTLPANRGKGFGQDVHHSTRRLHQPFAYAAGKGSAVDTFEYNFSRMMSSLSLLISSPSRIQHRPPRSPPARFKGAAKEIIFSLALAGSSDPATKRVKFGLLCSLGLNGNRRLHAIQTERYGIFYFLRIPQASQVYRSPLLPASRRFGNIISRVIVPTLPQALPGVRTSPGRVARAYLAPLSDFSILLYYSCVHYRTLLALTLGADRAQPLVADPRFCQNWSG